MKIPVYRNLDAGDKTIVGVLELDTSKLPYDPFFSIVLVNQKTSKSGYSYSPVAASIVDDYNLALALSRQYMPGSVALERIRTGDLA